MFYGLPYAHYNDIRMGLPMGWKATQSISVDSETWVDDNHGISEFGGYQSHSTVPDY